MKLFYIAHNKQNFTKLIAELREKYGPLKYFQANDTRVWVLLDTADDPDALELLEYVDTCVESHLSNTQDIAKLKNDKLLTTVD